MCEFIALCVCAMNAKTLKNAKTIEIVVRLCMYKFCIVLNSGGVSHFPWQQDIYRAFYFILFLLHSTAEQFTIGIVCTFVGTKGF